MSKTLELLECTHSEITHMISTVIPHECGHLLVAENNQWEVFCSVVRPGAGGFTVCMPCASYFNSEVMAALWGYVDSSVHGIDFKKEYLRSVISRDGVPMGESVGSLIRYVIAGSVAEGRDVGDIQGVGADSDREKFNNLREMLAISDERYVQIHTEASKIVTKDSIEKRTESYHICNNCLVYVPCKTGELASDTKN